MKSFEWILNNINKNTNLSDDEKNTILQKSLNKIETGRSFGIMRRKKVAILCVCMLSLSIIAVSAAVFTMNDGFQRYFRADENTKVSVGELKVDNKKSGYEVCTQQIIGDDYGIYVLFNVKGKDASDKSFQEINANVEGVKELNCSDPFQIGCDNENQSSFVLHITSPDILTGKKISIDFKNIGENVFNEEKDDYDFKTEVENTWNLAWKLDYTPNESSTIKINKPVSVYEGKAVWDSVSISPLSATIHLTELKDYNVHSNKPNDTLMIQLNDGTRIRSDYVDDSDVVNDTDTITMYFHKIVKFTDIQSVTFAGEKVDINKNQNLEIRKKYIDKDGKFTIDMPIQLSNIMDSVKVVKSTDEELNVEKTETIFTGKTNDVTTTLFIINQYKGDFSKEDMDIKKPMDVYLDSNDGYVYTITYGELETEEKLNNFADIFNSEVAKIKDYVDIVK